VHHVDKVRSSDEALCMISRVFLMEVVYTGARIECRVTAADDDFDFTDHVIQAACSSCISQD
jgi:hypothetical protein